MNRTILVSGTLALAIHALIFMLPLSKVMSVSHAPMNQPLALSIIHPKEPVEAMCQVEVSAETPVQPEPVEGNHSPTREKIILKKTVASKERMAEKNEAVKERYLEETAKTECATDGSKADRTLDEGLLDTVTDELPKRIDTAPRVRAASIVLDGEREGSTPRGDQPGSDIIVDARPKYKNNPLPRYPKVARRRGYEGRTVLRVEVLEDGKVGHIEIATSSGFEVLDKGALESVRGWTFFPGTRNGIQTKQWVMVPVRFSLR